MTALYQILGCQCYCYKSHIICTRHTANKAISTWYRLYSHTTIDGCLVLHIGIPPQSWYVSYHMYKPHHKYYQRDIACTVITTMDGSRVLHIGIPPQLWYVSYHMHKPHRKWYQHDITCTVITTIDGCLVLHIGIPPQLWYVSYHM